MTLPFPESLACFFERLDATPADGRPLHLAIGMFDGVHRGHQAVIGSAIQAARLSRGRSGVLTFWPHPSRLFNPECPVPMITEPTIKRWLLERVGVDWIIQQTFDQDFARITAEEFPSLLADALPDLQALYVGENFRFGKGRRGGVQLLVEREKEMGIQVVSADRLRFYGEPISSTRIRECLAHGQIEKANRMLGYAYFSLGKVHPGNQMGRKLGFPTLNLPWNPECRPALGVYRVEVASWQAQSVQPPHAGVANFGLRPTIGNQEIPVLEVHLTNAECPWSTGDALKVDWLEFLRPEKKFESLEALQRQIQEDCARVRNSTEF